MNYPVQPSRPRAIPMPPADDSGELPMPELSELDKLRAELRDFRVEQLDFRSSVVEILQELRGEVATLKLKSMIGGRAALAGVGLGGLGSALAELARAAGWL